MITNSVRTTVFGNSELPALVLVHGWGHHGGVWQILLSELQVHFYVHVLDLPGYGGAYEGKTVETDWQEDALLTAFLSLPTAIWCGWSLGGMLATRFASFAPERVTGLVTIASNPVFVEKIDWPAAMSGGEYQQFADTLNNDAKITLSRFASLVCQDSATIRADRRALKTVIAETVLPSPFTLQVSLRLLNELDTRVDISVLNLPQHHLLGEHDVLVPSSVAKAIDSLNSAAKVSVIKGAGHAPFLSHPAIVIEALQAMAKKL